MKEYRATPAIAILVPMPVCNEILLPKIKKFPVETPNYPLQAES
jgi:hypothetical protein